MTGPTFCVKLSEELALKLAQTAKTAGLMPEVRATVGAVKRFGYFPKINLQAEILEESDVPGETELFRLYTTPELAQLVREASRILRLSEADLFLIGARLLCEKAVQEQHLVFPLQLVAAKPKEEASA
jgi:hypothetical protein